MQIANPIYDTVFKYMMQDSSVAKLLLSAIIGEQITELSFSSKEHIRKVDVDKDKIDKVLEQLVVCHFDFEAKIKTKEGDYKTIIIELQKAKLATDIMRFRQYLGTTYQDTENSYDDKKQKARQIYCVYFLNYEVGYSDCPVVKVGYIVQDLATGKELKQKSEFVESLNHISWIVQVRQLKQQRRNELEELLSVFDQENIAGNRHFLEIDENIYPEKYRPIIRKLLEAYASKQVRDEMQIEDNFINELLDRDKLIAEQKKEIEKTKEELERKDNTIAEKENTIAEKENTIAEKENTIAEKDIELQKLKDELSKKEELIALLKTQTIKN